MTKLVSSHVTRKKWQWKRSRSRMKRESKKTHEKNPKNVNVEKQER